VEKVAEREKDFGNKSSPSTSKTVYLAQKDNIKPHDSSRGKRIRRGCGRGRKSFIGKGGRHNQDDRSNLHCTRCKNNGSHEADDYRFPCDNIKEYRYNKKEDKGKPSEPTKGNPSKFSYYIVAHCNT
jgi:hypothetical protein